MGLDTDREGSGGSAAAALSALSRAHADQQPHLRDHLPRTRRRGPTSSRSA